MKHLIIVLTCLCSLFPFYGIKSQEGTMTVSGWFDENNQYRSPFLSREIDNILFLELKGRMFRSDPRRGFYMKLDEASASKIGHTEIFVVPANEAGTDRFWWGTEEKMTIDISRLPGDDYIFYCNDDKLIPDGWKRMLDEEAAFWEKPRSLDLDKENIELSAKNRFIDLYIKQLDNHNKITLSRTIVKEEDFGATNDIVDVFEDSKPILLKDTFKLGIDSFYYRLKDPFTLDIDSPYFKFGKFPPPPPKRKETYLWKKETTVSDLALENLKEIWIPRLPSVPETLQEEDTGKADWKKWYLSLPTPEFEKPDVDLTSDEVAWDWNIAYYRGEDYFYQHRDSRDIYLFLSDSSYRFDTVKDSLIHIEEKLSDYTTEIWESKNEFENQQAKLWIEKEADKKLIYFDQYYLLPDGDMLIAIVSTNRLEAQLHVYLMKKGAGKPYKKLYLGSLIPIENSPGWGIHVMTVFQARGKYYLMANINRTRACWVVLNKSMFTKY